MTGKLPTVFQRFQTKVREWVNETGDQFNGDNVGTECNHESSNDEKTLFLIFLQICDSCFNPLPAKDICPRLLTFSFFCNI